MFYELVDKYQIIKAPYPLQIDDKDVFTNSEVIYNQQGFYSLESTIKPQDEFLYQPYFELINNKIIQKWESVGEKPLGNEM